MSTPSLSPSVWQRLPPPSGANDLVAKRGGDTIRLTDKPCPVEVLKHVAQGSRGYFREAQAVIEGKPWVACWAEAGGTVYLQFSDGDRGMVELAEFSDPSV